MKMTNIYWTINAWGDQYPPKNADEIIDAANALIDLYAESHDEDETESFSEILWDRYCMYDDLDTVIDDDGNALRFSAAVSLMDDDIREEIHSEFAPCSEQEFFSEYCRRHEERYGDRFTV